jgi:hypothetical protein
MSNRVIWSVLAFGLWLMMAPFAFLSLNSGAFQVLWEDLVLGFGIAIFAFCRLASSGSTEVSVADSVITTLASLTVINPFLFNYYNFTVGRWNNVIVGGIVFLLALYQDKKDLNHSTFAQQKLNS